MTNTFFAGIMALSLAAFVWAGTAAKEQKSWQVSPFLQIDALNVPKRDGGTGLVTVVLNAKDAEWIGRICAMMPRIRDAVLRSASRYPVQMVRGTMIATELANDLPRAINAALRDELIVAAKVFPGRGIPA
ncbi:MAG: flagellar basal body-associated FliL family protein [Proteobacteria bacterium]|nr:flagellar basal body-associated FliL family protein [Pseudomonadota bacterium]